MIFLSKFKICGIYENKNKVKEMAIPAYPNLKLSAETLNSDASLFKKKEDKEEAKEIIISLLYSILLTKNMMPTGKRTNAPAPLINTPKLDSFIISDNRRKNAEIKQKPTLAFFLEKIVSIVEGFPITKIRSQTMATISNTLTLAIKM
jgi:hypothetical protein